MSLSSLLPDSLRRTADLAAQFVLEHPETFRDFIDTSLAQEYPMSMRASRVVYLVGCMEPGLVRPHLGELVEGFPFLTDRSVKRNWLHLFENFTAELPEEHLGLLLQSCFAYIEDTSETIAIRTYSLKLLYLISQRVPELKPELISIIRHHMTEAPPGFCAQATQILKKLHKEIHEDI